MDIFIIEDDKYLSDDGTYKQVPPSTITGSILTSGTYTEIDSIATGTYDMIIWDYVIVSGSNKQAGTIQTIWVGTTTNYIDNGTLPFGTIIPELYTDIDGGNVRLMASSSEDNWNIKYIRNNV